MACAVRMGNFLQFLGIKIGSNREYNLFKDTQHLPALYMMEAGESAKMGGYVEYSCQPVSMYCHFYISTSIYIWPIL